jgi:ArsR family transcriptional regulator
MNTQTYVKRIFFHRWIKEIMDTIKAGVINDAEAEKLERIAFILKTIAHPTRLGIIHLLEQYPKLSVTQICEMLNSEQSLTSHHLQNMRLKGILSVKRDRRSMMYSLKERDVSLIIECLSNCQCNM